MQPSEIKWLIWSNEHGGWWRPGSWGYTTSRVEAGRYSFGTAMEIVQQANKYREDDQHPHEAMVPDIAEGK